MYLITKCIYITIVHSVATHGFVGAPPPTPTTPTSSPNGAAPPRNLDPYGKP